VRCGKELLTSNPCSNKETEIVVSLELVLLVNRPLGAHLFLFFAKEKKNLYQKEKKACFV